MLFFVRFVAGLFPLAVWIGAGVLAWQWWEGDPVRADDGSLVRVREDWMLWTTVALLVWGLLGRIAILPFIAKPDRRGTELVLRRQNGRMLGDAQSEDALYIEDHGPKDGLALVMTHGWGLDSRIWDDARDQLAVDHRVVTWDLPGLGRSRTTEVTLEHFADCLKRVVLETGADQVVLIGHSIGGMAIQTLLRDDPKFFRERVAGVVLLNTTDTAPQYTMIASGLVRALRGPVIEPLLHASIFLEPLAWLSAWQSYLSGTAHIVNRLGCSSTVTRSQLEAATLLQVKNRPSIQAKGDLAMFRWDPVEAAAQLPRPLLVIGGENDIVTKAIASDRLARIAPHAQLLIDPGANHMGPVDRADSYWRAVRGFLARLSRPSLPAPASDVGTPVDTSRRPARSA